MKFIPIANISVKQYNNNMTQGFFQFNNSIINKILNFTNSTFDLLFLSGQKGSAKSETIAKVLPELDSNTLVFQHFCFENTTINDFILNFYDALRNFSLAQKISLKKFTTNNLEDKVCHYFKTINQECLVVVENFECVESNIEIINFLSHLATYENVKIIILTRNEKKNLFKFKQIKVQELSIGQISKEEFQEKLTVLAKPFNDDFKEKFYNLTGGIELYLKMSVKFCSTTGIELNDLVDEYDRKIAINYMSFEEFLVSKFISLISRLHLPLFRLLCLIAHPVSKDFISTYELANVEYIGYLAKNYLVSFFRDEFYVKDYFKNHVLKTFSIQEKISNYKTLTQIYELELTKSPKDRLLRLSRETIRKEIERFNSLTPTINASKSNSMPYLGLGSWKDDKAKEKSKLAEKLEKIKEKRKLLASKQTRTVEDDRQIRLIQEEKDKERQFIISLINNARNLIKEYKYNDSISELLRAQNTDTDKEFAIEILMLLAKNYEQLNNVQTSQKCYLEALKLSVENKDSRKFEIEFLIAQTNKKLFKINVARTQFEQIAYNSNAPINYQAKAFIELGEINESNSNIKDAIKQYERALNIVIGKNKELACSAYYRLAVLYDENQDYQNAIKYYQKNYLTSSELKENKYYSISLNNLAQIYSEMSKYKEASDFLKLALQFDSENNNLEDMYFSQKELAKLYTTLDKTSAIGYFKQALDTAKKLKDSFKEALIYFEVGEFYYDKQEDEKALISFLNAKNVLKNSNDTQNTQRIISRIKDIKMRLNSVIFKVITEKYDKQ